MPQSSLNQLTSKADTIINNLENKINITIGSDPEFVILCGDNMENAIDVLKSMIDSDIKCKGCKPCENCEYFQSETYIKWDEDEFSDELKEHIKNIFDERMNFILNPDNYPNGMNTDFHKFVIPSIDFSALKASIYIYMMKKQYSSEEFFLENIFKTASIKILHDNNAFINKQYTHYKFWSEIERGWTDFDFLEDLKNAEIIFNTTNEYTHNFNLYLNIKSKDQNKAYQIKQNRIIDIEISPIYKSYKEFHDNFFTLYSAFLHSIITDIYKKIEIGSREKVCTLESEISECRMCENCDKEPDLTDPEVEIGCDGNTATGELRPKESNNPIDHFNKINQLINILFDMITEHNLCNETSLYQIRAGGYNADTKLGGHIHIGFPEHILKSNISHIENVNNLGLYLSYNCGMILKKLEHMDDIVNREPYGKFDWRKKKYGIEWRMPASWLVSPQYCIGALCLAYTIAYDFFELLYNDQTLLYSKIYEIQNKIYSLSKSSYEMNDNTFNYILYYTILDSSYINENIETKILSSIINNITKMTLFSEYQKYINPIIDMITKNEKWNTKENIFKSWIDPKLYNKVVIIPEQISKEEYLKRKN